MGVELIIAGGDSFTLGSELCADEFVEGYTSKLGKNDDLYNKHMEVIYSLSFSELMEYQKRCKQKTWANKLAKKLSIKISNVAVGGGSNEEIFFHIIEEFENQITKINPSKILILAMLSSPYRISELDFNEFRKFKIIGIEETINNRKYRERDFLWNSFCHIIGAKEYIESFGSKIIFLNSCLWETFGNKHIDNMIKISYDLGLCKNEDCLAGGHFTEKAHTLLAEKMYEDMK